jgi:uncharacterized protein YeaO (DUF488 family)
MATRGVKKAHAAIDEWIKDIAPSTGLRKWFGHDPARWQEFRRRYQSEIRQHPDEFDRLRTLAQHWCSRPMRPITTPWC